MKNVLVVHRPEEWPDADDIEIVSRRFYLRDASFQSRNTAMKVVNLSRDFGYQSLGYYVSLLADARGHRVTPSAALSQDVKNRSFLDAIDDELAPALKRGLDATKNKHVVRVELGKTERTDTSELGAKLFRLLPIPIFEAVFRRRDEGFGLSRVSILGDSDLGPEDRARVLRQLRAFFTKRTTRAPRRRSYRYDLAILHDPAAQDQPSNPRALKKFSEAADKLGIRPELITRDDYARLAEFDGLFIRETTFVNHHTYRFARRAQAEGIVVIDDPDSILRCTNKVFLAELLAAHRIPHPETRIITPGEVQDAAEESIYPSVLKQPDGSFSLGSYKVHDPEEYERRARQLLERSELILAQPFLPSDYDWRIGILGHELLFACRYFMAKGHWQIIQRQAGREIEGDHETIPVEQAPESVTSAALSATRRIGDGLYGVDLKEIDGKAYVIEVNDNPNIDAGVEDEVLKDSLYERIMRTFLTRMEQVKARRGEA